MRALAAIVLAFCLSFSSQAAAKKKTQRSTTHRTGSASAAKKPGTHRAATAAKKTSKTTATASSRRGTTSKGRRTAASSRRPRQTWRSGQMAPTPDRYREIQQALIEKGYEPGPVTGAWGPEWVSALKKYQQEQNLEPSGKLDSLSLISLGLGPRRDFRSPAALLNDAIPSSSSTSREIQ